MKNKEVVIKDLASKEQFTIKQEELEDKVVELMEKESHHCCCGEHHHHEGECCEGDDYECCCHGHKEER